MFALSLFTVAVAIIRGTISYGRIASDYSQSQNISWIWFWLQMELVVCKCAKLITYPSKTRSIPSSTDSPYLLDGG